MPSPRNLKGGSVNIKKIRLEVQGFKDTIISPSQFFSLFTNSREVLMNRRDSEVCVWSVIGRVSTNVGVLSYDKKEEEWSLKRP